MEVLSPGVLRANLGGWTAEGQRTGSRYRGAAVRANRSGMSWVAGEGGVAGVGATLATRLDLMQVLVDLHCGRAKKGARKDSQRPES